MNLLISYLTDNVVIIATVNFLMKGKEETFTRKEKRISNLKNNRIEPGYIGDLLLDYSIRKSIKSDYKMSNELAEVIMIIIEKIIGGSNWRGYSEDWKEEFRGRATEHCIKYCHNFSPEKCKNGKDDAFNYIAMISSRAFIQSMRKCKAYTDKNISLNHDLMYDQQNWGDDLMIDFDSNIPVGTVSPSISSIDWGSEIW
jgi:hypothetical protein